eukprot:scaffold285936_cov22-Tisochrysis_lutea.AAC.3
MVHACASRLHCFSNAKTNAYHHMMLGAVSEQEEVSWHFEFVSGKKVWVETAPQPRGDEAG